MKKISLRKVIASGNQAECVCTVSLQTQNVLLQTENRVSPFALNRCKRFYQTELQSQAANKLLLTGKSVKPASIY
jgi:hypothetical protein